MRDFYPGTERLQTYADIYSSRLVVGGRALYQDSLAVLRGSNGTAAGTVLLGDIHPGLDASSPGPFTPIDGGLVLAGANDGEHGRELWAIPIEP